MISTTQLHVASSVFWNNVVMGLFVQDIWMGLIKPVFLGFVLVTIACHVGLRTTGGTRGVGRATTQAVVAGSVALGFGAPFFAAAQAELEARCAISYARGAVVRPGGLGDRGPLLGAAALAWKGDG